MTSSAFGSLAKHMRIRCRKKFVICSNDLPFCVTMRVLHRQKETSKWKRLGHRMMHGNTLWKTGISEIAKASRGVAFGPHKGGLQHPIWTSSCNGQRADDARWLTVYAHKTQFFMKNWDQQKCLGKALPSILLCICKCCLISFQCFVTSFAIPSETECVNI